VLQVQVFNDHIMGILFLYLVSYIQSPFIIVSCPDPDVQMLFFKWLTAQDSALSEKLFLY